MIELEHVCVKRQGRAVVDDASFSVADGELVALVGPSGSGKSTLLRAVLGLDPPHAGRILVGGACVSDGKRELVTPEARNVAMVFQDLALWPHMSVKGNLEFGLKARGHAAAQREARVQQALEWVSMADKSERSPGELSGGERQRVAIARALVLDPRAILLDEPLANLDIALKAEILAVLATLLGERGIPAVYVTHDPWEAARLAQRVAVLEAGRVTQWGTFEELAASPSTSFVEAFARAAGWGVASGSSIRDLPNSAR
ncbi:MAG: ABC transporter ATP-binding protein [Deltaproteobacteria bacterium]|nr:ABC transporter ATP-binding protein [Deltaproteobacteria bacterium]